MQVAILVLAVVIVRFGETVGQEWTYSQELNPGFTLQWNYDEESIEMKITAPTRGWVGIGFGIDNTMAGADIIIGGVKDGEPYASDWYARRNGPPAIDVDQNVQILNGTENDTFTSITLRRPLSSNNVFDKAITSGTMIILWAYGRFDKDKVWQPQDYHRTNRGSMDLVLLGGKKSTLKPVNIVSTTASATKSYAPATSKATVSSTVSQTQRINPKPRPRTTTMGSPKTIASNQYTTGFPYTTVLDESSSVVIFWDFDETTITIQMIAPTTGWIGIGFARTASMNGADLIMMGVKGDETYALDCHSERNGVPDVDDEQNVQVVAGWENGTHTGVTIRRNRLTCNAEDMDIQLSTYKVLWAFGAEDLDESLSFRLYHRRNRGGKSLKLINPVEFRKREELSRELHIDIGPTNFLVPAETTYYLCKYVKVAEANDTIYVTGYEAFLTKGNEKRVHHATIYICDVDVDEETLQNEYRCYEQIHPFSVGCNKILGGWAVGSTGIRFPENTGMRLRSTDHPQYAMIEMHYDNPDKQEFLDSSGMRLSYVTEEPRYMVGMFDVSQTVSTMWIPPGAENFRIDGYCREKCISKGMEKSGISEIKVFGVLFHSHLSGRAMRLRHFRNGVELPAMARDEYYDFNYQEVQYFEEPKALKEGDSLRVECDYSTMDRTDITPGGLPTTSEMCIAFVLHYPSVDMSICGSRAKLFEDPSKVFKLATGLNITLNRSELFQIGNEMRINYWEAMGIFGDKVLHNVEWDDQKRKFSQDFIDNLTLYTTCIDRRINLLNFYEEFVTPRGQDYVDNNPICLPSETPPESMPSGTVLSSAAGVAAVIILLLGAARIMSRKS